MHMVPVAILAIIGLFTVLLTGVILFFRTRHRERLALIKYDKEASIFKPDRSPKRSTLKWALLAMGAGAGILIGTAIDSIFRSAPGGVFSCLLIFGGAALFIYYSIMNREAQAQANEEDDFI